MAGVNIMKNTLSGGMARLLWKKIELKKVNLTGGNVPFRIINSKKNRFASHAASVTCWGKINQKALWARRDKATYSSAEGGFVIEGSSRDRIG